MQLALWRCGREAHPARMGAALQPFDEMPNEPWVHETKNNEEWIVLDFFGTFKFTISVITAHF